jgi:hypothetical protein
MTAILYLSQLYVNVKIVIIKYLFSHSLRYNIECIYIYIFVNFYIVMLVKELVFGLAWMVI